MISKYFLLLLPCLLWATHCLGQAVQKAPERELGDFFSSLTGKEMRELFNSRDRKEDARIFKELNQRLMKEDGKSWTVHCTSSGKTTNFTNVTGKTFTLSSDATRSLVRVNGERIYVKVYAHVPAALIEKLNECRTGRKIFVSGTVTEVGIGKSSSAGNGLAGAITIKVDDIGLDK